MSHEQRRSSMSARAVMFYGHHNSMCYVIVCHVMSCHAMLCVVMYVVSCGAYHAGLSMKARAELQTYVVHIRCDGVMLLICVVIALSCSTDATRVDVLVPGWLVRSM